VTDESVSGTRGIRHRAKPFTISADQVRSIEIGDERNDPTKNVLVFFAVGITMFVVWGIMNFPNAIRFHIVTYLADAGTSITD
jgi:hypothetical protein